MRRLSVFDFKSVRPHVSTSIGGMSTCTSGRSSGCGFFYCCIRDKVGTVFSESTKLLFKEFW